MVKSIIKRRRAREGGRGSSKLPATVRKAKSLLVLRHVSMQHTLMRELLPKRLPPTIARAKAHARTVVILLPMVKTGARKDNPQAYWRYQKCWGLRDLHGCAPGEPRFPRTPPLCMCEISKRFQSRRGSGEPRFPRGKIQSSPLGWKTKGSGVTLRRNGV